MRIIVNLFISLLLMFSTKPLFSKDIMKKKSKTNYVIYVNEIVNQFAKEMNDKHGFICIGSGGGMPYDVEEIFVKFQVYQRVNIEQARALEVIAIKRLKELINSHEKIRPFLREHPFSSNRCHVFIVFRQPNNHYYTDGSIAYVFQTCGILYYFIEKENAINQEEVFSESIGRAEEIVEKEMNSEKSNYSSIKKL